MRGLQKSSKDFLAWKVTPALKFHPSNAYEMNDAMAPTKRIPVKNRAESTEKPRRRRRKTDGIRVISK